MENFPHKTAREYILSHISNHDADKELRDNLSRAIDHIESSDPDLLHTYFAAVKTLHPYIKEIEEVYPRLSILEHSIYTAITHDELRRAIGYFLRFYHDNHLAHYLPQLFKGPNPGGFVTVSLGTTLELTDEQAERFRAAGFVSTNRIQSMISASLSGKVREVINDAINLDEIIDSSIREDQLRSLYGRLDRLKDEEKIARERRENIDREIDKVLEKWKVD